jgi:hypothetical protein
MRWDIFLFAAGAVLTVLAVRLGPGALFWDLCLWVGILIMILSAAHGAWRRKSGDQKLDPFLGIAIASSLTAVVFLTAYALRSQTPTVTASAAAPSGISSGVADRPEVLMTPPSERHEIRWDSKRSNGFLVAPEGQISDQFWKVPIFKLRAGKTAISDANIKWQSNISGIENLLKDAPHLSATKFNFDNDGRLTIQASGQFPIPHAYNIAQSYTLPVPFITSAGNDAFIPLDVYLNVALYALAVVPASGTGSKIERFPMTATVSWNLPQAGSQKFSVTAIIENAKPPNLESPDLDVLVSFKVEPED